MQDKKLKLGLCSDTSELSSKLENAYQCQFFLVFFRSLAWRSFLLLYTVPIKKGAKFFSSLLQGQQFSLVLLIS